MFHCGFEGLNLTFTSDIKEALTNAKYVVSSGGAARKAGMTREDLLKGNAAIAEEFGKNVKAYCPDVKHVVVIFNPADITGLITLLYSGLKPSQVTTLAALDSTRLRSELSKHFGIAPDKLSLIHILSGQSCHPREPVLHKPSMSCLYAGVEISRFHTANRYIGSQ